MSDSNDETYSVGAVSKVTGLSPDVLRAWERRYGVVEPLRTEGGTRRYRPADLERLVYGSSRFGRRDRFAGCRPRFDVESGPDGVDRRSDPLVDGPTDVSLDDLALVVHDPTLGQPRIRSAKSRSMQARTGP